MLFATSALGPDFTVPPVLCCALVVVTISARGVFCDFFFFSVNAPSYDSPELAAREFSSPAPVSPSTSSFWFITFSFVLFFSRVSELCCGVLVSVSYPLAKPS